MTLTEQIRQQVEHLPPDKQREVLDFVAFLRQRLSSGLRKRDGSLRKHPAFGLWSGRQIDSLTYQQDLRAEWDQRP